MNRWQRLIRAGLILMALENFGAANAAETWTSTQLEYLERTIAPARLTHLQREMAEPIFKSIHEYLATDEDRTFPLWIRTKRAVGNTFLIDRIATVLWDTKRLEHVSSEYFQKPWLAHRPRNIGSVLILDHLASRYGRHTKLAELEAILTELFEHDHYGVVVLLDDENAFEKLGETFRRRLTVVNLIPVIESCESGLEA